MSKTFIKIMLILMMVFLSALSFIYILNSLTSTDNDVTGSETISLPGTEGSIGIQMNNPAKSPNFESVGANVYVSDERKLGENIGFSVAYYEEGQSFAIDISGKPTATYRQKASEYLLETLQISEEEACRLNVYVGVTYGTNPNLAGQNLGLSFCPGSVQL